MNSIRKYLSGFLAVVLAVAGLTYIDDHIRTVRAASQMASIVCDNFKPISVAANTQLITAGGSNQFIYICSYNLNNGFSGSTSFSLVEGTGTTCATGIAAVVGSTTAANGPLLTGPGGTINYGGGTGAVAKTAVAGDNVCLLVTTIGPVAGVIGWTSAPY